MDEMVTIYLFGKKYDVPADLTIMRAMEYAGYQLIRGCGCRNGFCGACATIYRIKGDRELKVCLACQTKVENDMYSSFVGEEVMENIASPTPGMDSIAHCPGMWENGFLPSGDTTRKVFTSGVSMRISVTTPIFGIKVSSVIFLIPFRRPALLH